MTPQMSHVVVYDPEASLKIMKAKEAAMLMNITPAMLKAKIENDELYREAFWKEGTVYRTSVGNLLKLQAKLGERNANA